MLYLTKFWWLLCTHALTDYVLQSEAMSSLKSPAYQEVPGFPRERYGPWWWWMLAHGMINALGVLYVTQNFWCSLGECTVHCMLDYLKCTQRLTTNQDQLGHILSKIIWALA